MSTPCKSTIENIVNYLLDQGFDVCHEHVDLNTGRQLPGTMSYNAPETTQMLKLIKDDKLFRDDEDWS
jgi:ribulose bisphosphate carboxylase small subunit